MLRISPAILTIIALFHAAAFSHGCKSSNRSGLRDAVVSPPDADRAYRIVENTRNYLPYEYSADGCYARATYMQMELFAANIPSRVVYIRTTWDEANQSWAEDGPRLDPAGWVYHVAPVIRVDGQEIVLDPGLERDSAGGALKLEDWLARMRAIKFVEAPAGDLKQKVGESVDRFVLSRAGNSDDGPVNSENLRGQVIRSASDMPFFSSEAMMWYFQTMDLYLVESVQKKSITETEMSSRRSLLAARTVELAGILESRNKVRGPGGDLEGVKVTLDSLRDIQKENDLAFSGGAQRE